MSATNCDVLVKAQILMFRTCSGSADGVSVYPYILTVLNQII